MTAPTVRSAADVLADADRRRVAFWRYRSHLYHFCMAVPFGRQCRECRKLEAAASAESFRRSERLRQAGR